MKENTDISLTTSKVHFQKYSNQSPKPKANIFKFNPDSIKPNNNSKGSEPMHETSISSNTDLTEFQLMKEVDILREIDKNAEKAKQISKSRKFNGSHKIINVGILALSIIFIW